MVNKKFGLFVGPSTQEMSVTKMKSFLEEEAIDIGFSTPKPKDDNPVADPRAPPFMLA